jgi:FAD/FMN-containing dehydrogenase
LPAVPLAPTTTTNWARTQRSSCYRCPIHDLAGLTAGLAEARSRHLSAIAHGAGHSYTDAALNTGGLIVDLRGMRRILSWDPLRGVIRVEPGVTLRDLVRLTLPKGWWPPVTPSTAEATIGGCVAMNVNGKNAWKVGSFGEHVRSLTILLASGELLTITPESHSQLFRAVVGGAGLLGVIVAIELQLQRVGGARVDLRVRPAASLGELLTMLRQENSADFLEGWVDGLARGHQLGRGLVTCATFAARDTHGRSKASDSLAGDHRVELALARLVGALGRPARTSSVYLANRLAYWWGTSWGRDAGSHRSLVRSTYYSPAVLAAAQALLPHGLETFQAFAPTGQAEGVFKQVLLRSHDEALTPLWCVVKRHRADPFLLRYQVDGFSLEVNYHREPRTRHRLHGMLQELMQAVIAAGGRFYLAKDALLTGALYRRSIGEDAVEAFLQLKRTYDPDGLFQSDLFRRVFAPAQG